MECSELTSLVIEARIGQLNRESRRALAEHLERCPECREEARHVEEVWTALGQDPDAVVTAEFRRRTLALLEEELIRSRIRMFRPRARSAVRLAQAAALVLAVGAGYSIGHRGTAPAAGRVATSRPEIRLPEADSMLSNVSYRPADAEGKIGISYDVVSRATVVGRPEDPAMAKLLAYLVSRNTQTAGEKSRAIELVSSHYGASVAPASADIVRALTSTLRKDQNPGVRKKAADALAGFRMTPEIRNAFLDALRSDPNPAVRLVTVEALAAAAKESPDSRTIESLRDKAVDPHENRFVRAKAASALKAIEF